MSNYQIQESNAWNPFIPTKRDLKRTEELATKNSFIAAFITFLFLPLGLIYLNRGINFLKITGYVCAFSFAVGLSAISSVISEEKANKIAHSIGMLEGIAASAE